MKKLHLRRHGVSRTARSAKAGFVLAVAAASGLFSRQASAQVTGTWTEGDTGAGELWTDSGNWLGGVIPGNDTGVTNNTDTAVFNGSPSSNVVNLNGNWNLQNILFDTANATNFAIGPTGVTTYSLLLTGGTGAESASQSITVNSTVDNGSDEIINAPIVIEGNSYAFIDKSTTSTAGLQISGNVSGGVAGTTNLYLDGANEISSSTGNSAIVSDISNGAATTLNLVMNGTGEWELRTTDTNTYTGSTTINSGTLRVTTTGALPTTTDVTVNGPTALFYLSATTFPTVHSLTLLNGGSAVQVNQSGSCGLYIANNTGTGFTWNATGLTSTVSDFRFQLDFTGTGAAGTGGLTFLNGPNTPTQKFGSANYGIDLGTVNRIFNIEQGGQSIAGQSFNSSDLQLYGLINDSGGITKTGAGILKFQNPSNDVPETFTGPIEIQQGTLRLIGADLANPLCGTNALLVDGGKLDINTANATFGAATFTSGSIVSGTVTNSSATIFAPSFTFNLASGVTFTSAASFGDGSSGVVRTGGPAWGTANLSLTGPGTLVMNGTNSTYSGGTTVNSGTLLVNAAGALPANEPVTVKGGVLRLATGVSGGSGPAVTSPIDLTSLSITGSGVLDINNDHLIITYGATDPITTIAGYIKAGYNSGGWNGPGIISSVALTNASGLEYGVGYADGNEHVVTGLSSGQIEVAYTLLGDANLDGLVNGSDFNILAANFNQSITGWDQGDFNYDGLVNASDFNVLAANFNQGVSGAASSGDVAALDAFAVANGLSLPTSSVPEPATTGLLAMGAIGLLARHRRHSR